MLLLQIGSYFLHQFTMQLDERKDNLDNCKKQEKLKNQTAFRKSIRLLSWSFNGGWWVVRNWAPLLLLLVAHSSHEERTFWFNSLSSVVSSSWHLTVEESLVCRGQGCCGRSMRWCSTYWHQEAGFLTTLELLCSVNVQFCTLSLLRAQHYIISIIFSAKDRYGYKTKNRMSL